MRLAVLVVAGIISPLAAAAAIWLLVTGRSMPGVLGRGFTTGDNLRLKRAPAIYFRALGALLAVSAINVLLIAWVATLWPTTSLATLTLVAIVVFVMLFPTGAALVWVFVLAYRHRLFRWDKP